MADILVIEDEELMGELLVAHLRGAGYSVRLRADSASAILALLEQRPDLVLLDLALPYLDGLDLLEAVKGDDATRRIPVVVLTARADLASEERARAAGVNDYLVKPVTREVLLGTVRKQLAAAQA